MVTFGAFGFARLGWYSGDISRSRPPSVQKQSWTLALSLTLACLVTTDSQGALRHQYTFNDGTANDVVVGGTAHGTLSGNAQIFAGQLVLDGSPNTTLDLPAAAIGINNYSAITVTVWATPSSAMTGFTSLLGFGDATTTDPNLAANYFILQTHRGDNTSRAAISISNDATPFTEEDLANGPEYNDNLQHHYAAVLTNTSISLYTDGQLRQTTTVPVNGAANMISGIGTGFAKIGSAYPADPLFVGTVNQVRIYDEARSALQILLEHNDSLCSCAGPTMNINRDTGTITLTNGQPASNVVGYSITSASGALNQAAWLSIAGNYDADSGNHSFDGDDRWSKLSTAGSKTDFSEFEFDGGNGGKLGTGTGGTASLQLGASGAWRKSIYEDLQIDMRLSDGTDVPVLVRYTGGMNNLPYRRSDLNFDGAIDLDDWNIFLANSGSDVSHTSPAESYALGNLNGDLLHNREDFRLFKTDFIAAQGAGAFTALAGVPEPDAHLLMFTAAVCLTGLQFRRHSGI